MSGFILTPSPGTLEGLRAAPYITPRPGTLEGLRAAPYITPRPGTLEGLRAPPYIGIQFIMLFIYFWYPIN